MKHVETWYQLMVVRKYEQYGKEEEGRRTEIARRKGSTMT